jgi:TonB family protein
MKIKILLILTLASGVSFGQVKTKKMKLVNEEGTEKFEVIKDNPIVKHGDYIKISRNGNIACTGHYNNGEKSGNWYFYNPDNSVIYGYNYDKKTVLEDKGNYCFGDSILYKGGEPPVMLNRNEYFQSLTNLIRYPQVAKETGISGIVVISVYVDSTGNAIDFMLKKSIAKSLDDEALRVIGIIYSDLKWMPGTKNGTNVESTYCLPIKFLLN